MADSSAGVDGVSCLGCDFGKEPHDPVSNLPNEAEVKPHVYLRCAGKRLAGLGTDDCGRHSLRSCGGR